MWNPPIPCFGVYNIILFFTKDFADGIIILRNVQHDFYLNLRFCVVVSFLTSQVFQVVFCCEKSFLSEKKKIWNYCVVLTCEF